MFSHRPPAGLSVLLFITTNLSLNLSKPLFPHLPNGPDDAYLTRPLGKQNVTVCVKRSAAAGMWRALISHRHHFSPSRLRNSGRIVPIRKVDKLRPEELQGSWMSSSSNSCSRGPSRASLPNSALGEDKPWASPAPAWPRTSAQSSARAGHAASASVILIKQEPRGLV